MKEAKHPDALCSALFSCDASILANTRQIEPAWRFHVIQRDHLEPVGGLGIAAAKGGSVKSRRLGQICVGANSRAQSASHVTSSAAYGPCRCGLPRPHDTRRPKSPMALLDDSVRSPTGSADEMCSRSVGLSGLESRPERGCVPGRDLRLKTDPVSVVSQRCNVGAS